MNIKEDFKEVFEEMKELVKETIDSEEELDLEELTAEYYDADINFKHCDKTTGQRCFDYEDIETAFKKAIIEQKKVV